VSELLSLFLQPYQQDCKALEGFTSGYRVDQREFRILFYVQEMTDEQMGQVQIF
jgi:mRNA interferase RelE/StbE